MKIKNLAWTLCILTSSLVFAESKTFAVDTSSSKNLVMFESDAPMEKVVGKTSNITGTAQLDLDDLANGAGGKFEVDLTTLDTGIGLRNQHMRNNHLETDSFPKAVFTLKSLSAPEPAVLTTGSSVRATAEGTFEIHGVAKDYSIPVTLTRTETGIWAEANWSITLQDHQIKRPEFLIMKLAEEQKITVQCSLVGQ